ncbi:hypothetical protein HELRODRAFT_75660, partial [Helobdella robusta]|uniref:Phosphoribosyltransferase domain-containing protein n=1 Tax=Helobdella robusta TaxID=6412 RepID=T1G285_HELRO
IKDLDKEYKPELFSIPKQYERYVESVIVPYGLIKDRVERLAEDIIKIYKDKDELVCVCILKGAFRFYCDLVHNLRQAIRHSSKELAIIFEFLQLSSYENVNSTGKLNFVTMKTIFNNFRGRNVLIIEDIIDTGFTMKELLNSLKEYNCKSVNTVSLKLKIIPMCIDEFCLIVHTPIVAGFVIPDRFIIGYGADYNDYFRDLDHICIINELGKEELKKVKA